MFSHETMPYESDMHGLLKPSHLLRFMIHSCSVQVDEEGSTRCLADMNRHTGWMLARLEQEQHCPIRAGEKLVFRCSYRQQSGAAYLREVKALRGEETVAACRMLWMLVDLDARRILRPGEIEVFCGDIPKAEGIAAVPRVIMPETAEKLGTHRVRYSECDRNGHYSSPNYIDLICDTIGHWKGEEKLLSRLSIEYHSEFLPEETLEILGNTAGESIVVRGQHTDGTAGFAALLTEEKIQP